VNTADLLVDAFGRIQEMVHHAVAGLTPSELAYRPDPDANSIAWLVWHLTRVQDDHVADVAGVPQVWTAQRWAERFALPFDTAAIGYGHNSEEVGAVRAGVDELLGYYDAVHGETVRYVSGLGDADLDRVVDERWDPPVTLGVRLVSVVNDDVAHAAQAAYVRGLLERRDDPASADG
jgi:DinB superfamily